MSGRSLTRPLRCSTDAEDIINAVLTMDEERCAFRSQIAALEADYDRVRVERDVLSDTAMKLESENEDYKITFKQKLLDNGKLRAKRDRLRGIIEMAWKGYGYDQEWDCDCSVCAAIRARTPHGAALEEGGDG